jgi:hypothetical protein
MTLPDFEVVSSDSYESNPGVPALLQAVRKYNADYLKTVYDPDYSLEDRSEQLREIREIIEAEIRRIDTLLDTPYL